MKHVNLGMASDIGLPLGFPRALHYMITPKFLCTMTLIPNLTDLSSGIFPFPGEASSALVLSPNIQKLHLAPEANVDLARESGYWLISKRGPGPRSRQITLDRFV